jgi:antirestriction protein ArdC
LPHPFNLGFGEGDRNSRYETMHWTRRPARLDREFGRKRWGDEGYAAEELVAELGSAFLSAISA